MGNYSGFGDEINRRRRHCCVCGFRVFLIEWCVWELSKKRGEKWKIFIVENGRG